MYRLQWFHQRYIAFCVLLLWIRRLFFLCFLIIFFLRRLLVLYFSLVAPAVCYLFFLHVVLYVFLANKWWWCVLHKPYRLIFIFFHSRDAESICAYWHRKLAIVMVCAVLQYRVSLDRTTRFTVQTRVWRVHKAHTRMIRRARTVWIVLSVKPRTAPVLRLSVSASTTSQSNKASRTVASLMRLFLPC